MDLKYRKIIAHIKPLHLVARFFMYNSSYFFYKKYTRKSNNNDVLRELKGSKTGKRCFIIGNGPSLSIGDLEKISDEDCFASNDIHKIFSQTSWRPKYYLIKDRYSKTSGAQLEALDVPVVFVGDYYLRYHDVKRGDIICLHEHYSINEKQIPFSNDISKKFYNAATVLYGIMQIAAYMDYSEVYLLGVDHNYSFEFAKDGSVIRTDQEQTHFFKDEIPEDIIADVRGMTRAYESFKKYADAHNITVKNATRGGKLEVFERVNFDDIVAQNSVCE